MKHLLLYAGTIVFAASTALAAPVNPCVSGDTLAQYESLDGTGCTTGSGSTELLFSNFADTEQGSVTASEIDVFVTASNQLEFTSGFWSVQSPQALDSTISFAVSTFDGANLITGISLNDVESITGGGITGVSESYCLGSLQPTANCPHSDGSLSVGDPPSGNDGPNSVTFAATNELTVTKDIEVTATSPMSTAKISDVFQSYNMTTVPEPMSYVLLGSGLLGFGLMRKRARRR